MLILPIDGSEHILTAEDVTGLMEELELKVVIPMHYRTRGAVTVLNTLQAPDYWLEMMPDAILHTGSKWTFSKPDLVDQNHYKQK